jgi:hypothetical protein
MLTRSFLDEFSVWINSPFGLIRARPSGDAAKKRVLTAL